MTMTKTRPAYAEIASGGFIPVGDVKPEDRETCLQVELDRMRTDLSRAASLAHAFNLLPAFERWIAFVSGPSCRTTSSRSVAAPFWR